MNLGQFGCEYHTRVDYAAGAHDAMCWPGVYVWHTPDRTIYVGMSGAICDRVNQYLGLQWPSEQERYRDFQLWARYFEAPLLLSTLRADSRPQAHELESRVIVTFRPYHNATGNYPRPTDACFDDVVQKLAPWPQLTEAERFAE